MISQPLEMKDITCRFCMEIEENGESFESRLGFAQKHMDVYMYKYSKEVF